MDKSNVFSFDLEQVTSRQNRSTCDPSNAANTLSTRGGVHVAYCLQGDGSTSMSGHGSGWNEEVSFTLNLVDRHSVADNTVVRRLTPKECERLQGFPDDYTALGSDTARYKALGNSMAVPVMRWIGERIDFVEGLDV